MAYDARSDAILDEIGSIDTDPAFPGEKTLIVRVRQYSGGAIKIAIERTYTNKNGQKRESAAGRLTPGELGALMGLHGEGINLLEKAHEIAHDRELQLKGA